MLPKSGFARSGASAAAVLASAALLLWPAGAGAAPAGAITEFSSGLNPGGAPSAIAAGPDGNLWFTDEGTMHAIGRITPSGAITEFTAGLAPGSRPYGIAAGPDGNLWFTDRGTTPAIGRITPSGAITEFTAGLPSGSEPLDITPGPDGAVWFADRGAHAIGRITPSGAITEYAAGLNAGSSPRAITHGPDGNLWFIDKGSTQALGRIAPSGAITEFSAGLNGGSVPFGIAPGPDGNLWFSDLGTTRAIGRITPDGAITEFSAGLNEGSIPVGIAPGPDGALWFTDIGTTPAIGRITSSGAITEYSSGLGAHSAPVGIAAGADGNLWFADQGEVAPAIGQVGAGAPSATRSAPSVSGGGRVGVAQTCTGAAWSSWSAPSASASLYPFDGYRWLLDGAPIAEGRSYTPPASDLGHELSCAATVTYPMLLVSARAVSASLKVGPAPPPAPVLSAVRQSASHWREGRAMARISRQSSRPGVGTTFSFKVSEQATVRFTFMERTTGRSVGHSCVPASAKNRGRHTCSRSASVGVLSLTARGGARKVSFQGRVSSTKRLPTGRYTVLITASDGPSTSLARSLSFTIVR